MRRAADQGAGAHLHAAPLAASGDVLREALGRYESAERLKAGDFAGFSTEFNALGTTLKSTPPKPAPGR